MCGRRFLAVFGSFCLKQIFFPTLDRIDVLIKVQIALVDIYDAQVGGVLLGRLLPDAASTTMAALVLGALAGTAPWPIRPMRG